MLYYGQVAWAMSNTSMPESSFCLRQQGTVSFNLLFVLSLGDKTNNKRRKVPL